MFGRIFNLFKTKQAGQNSAKKKEMSKNMQQPNNTKKRFEIELYEEVTDDNGDVKGFKKVITDQPVIIEATNKADLDRQAEIFRQVGQKMKIIKVLDDGGSNANSQPQQQVTEQPIAQNAPTSQVSQPQVQVQNIQLNKPKFYNVGGVEVKDDNGKIYQKQWVRLTENEAKNIRLVNETTNKIVNTTGKCFEMKKWILVETKQEDDTLELDDDEQV